MSGVDGKLAAARLFARNYERSCRTFGARSVEAALMRNQLWSKITAAIRELAEEVGDVTAGRISSDEIEAPSQEWAKILCTAVALRVKELARAKE
jgi:hypothetical protein